MTVRTRARELLLATVLFPLLSPALLVERRGDARNLLRGRRAARPVDMGEVSDWLVLLGVFDAVAIVGGLAMFGALVED